MIARIGYLTNENALLRNLVPDFARHLGFDVEVIYTKLSDNVDERYDLLLSDRYPHKVPPQVLHAYEGRNVNLHASIIPSYRGSYPILFALLYGDQPGWSIHEMTDRVDSGRVYSNGLTTLDFRSDTVRSVWLRTQLNMLNALCSNLLPFYSNRCFIETPSVDTHSITQSFFYRRNLSDVSQYLTSSWDTPIKQIYGCLR